MIARLDLLELFHPDGEARRAVVLGGACPDELVPAPGRPSGLVDLAVVAPTRAELRTPGWLERAATSLQETLGPDGIIYALLPARQRRRCRRLFRAAGFVLDGDVLHLPGWSPTHSLVPVRPPVLRRALESLASLSPWRRRFGAAASGVPGVARLLGVVHDTVALTARRAGARPLFEWLFRAAGLPAEGGTAMVRVKWRAGRGAVVLQAFDGGGRAVAVAKTTLTSAGPDDRAGREVERLARLGPAARRAGAAVPSARLGCVGGWPIALEDVIAGDRASELLDSGRASVEAMLGHLARWLDAWSRSTSAPHALDHERLVREILGPARLVAPGLEGGTRYLSWLEARCAALTGTVVPLVATHGDLTMSNLLLDERGRLGVLDWEASAAQGLPLRDLWYAAVDAAAAADRYVDRAAAFARCFADGGPLARTVATHEQRLRGTVGVSDELATLAFHGCWLQHAVDEQRKRKPGDARPFLAIAQWLAHRPTRFDGPAGAAA